MAKFIGRNIRVKVGSTELTTNIASVEVTETVDEIETTAFGQAARSRIAGLKDASVTISLHQDYDASSVNATLTNLFGGTSTVTILAGTSLTQGTATSTAPLFSIPVLVAQNVPVNGQVGDLTTFDITFPATGEITRSTAGTF
jgi:hypothetical protein